MDFATSSDPAVQRQLDRLAALSVPQGRLGLTATRSPTARPVTPGPRAATTPAPSWPRIIGSRTRIGPKPPSW